MRLVDMVRWFRSTTRTAGSADGDAALRVRDPARSDGPRRPWSGLPREATHEGGGQRREAMHLRGAGEDELGHVLTRSELTTPNRLLEKLTLPLEQTRAD